MFDWDFNAEPMFNATRITYTFIPLPFWDKEEEQWKPSVKVLINGEFFSWEVLELGFDEPRFTLPYAREFCREKMIMFGFEPDF